MRKRGFRIGFAVLLGCWIALGSALPPADSKDESRPPVKTSAPTGECRATCDTMVGKNCAGGTCAEYKAYMTNGVCTCDCQDRCDAAGRLIKKGLRR